MFSFNPRYPTVEDLRLKAKKKIPGFAFDYLDSGSGGERAVHRNRDAWNNILLRQHTMRDVSKLDSAVELFGTQYSHPYGVAPMGGGNIIWPGAENALAKAAHMANIPYVLSMMGSTLLEEIAEITEGKVWFQLYPTSDWSISADLLSRAKSAGCKVLVVTVDVPIMPKREREMRSGLQNKLISIKHVTPLVAKSLNWKVIDKPASFITLSPLLKYPVTGMDTFDKESVNITPIYNGKVLQNRKKQIKQPVYSLL